LLIEYAMPWYFQFVVSWQRAEREGRLSLCWLNYETMIADKPRTIERLLAFYGISAPRQAIQDIINASEADPRGNRFNQGIAGRGQSSLTGGRAVLEVQANA